MAGKDPTGVPPEAALQISIHCGNIDSTDKLSKIIPAYRLDGHRNLSEQIYLPNVNLRPLNGGPL
jgi:hypothetical protein